MEPKKWREAPESYRACSYGGRQLAMFTCIPWVPDDTGSSEILNLLHLLFLYYALSFLPDMAGDTKCEYTFSLFKFLSDQMEWGKARQIKLVQIIWMIIKEKVTCEDCSFIGWKSSLAFPTGCPPDMLDNVMLSGNYDSCSLAHLKNTRLGTLM